jgi:ABC-type branched-subunit amino acid transport system substrate-binding protein
VAGAQAFAVVAHAHGYLHLTPHSPLLGRTWQVGPDAESGIKLAIEDWATQDWTPGHTVATIESGDTMCSSGQATGELSKLLNTAESDTVLGIVGPGCSGATKNSNSLSQFFDRPQMCYGCSSPTLNRASDFPYFLRGCVDGQAIIESQATLAIRLGVKHTLILFDTSVFNDEMRVVFTTIYNTAGGTIHEINGPYGSRIDPTKPAEAKEVLTKAAETTAVGVVLLGYTAFYQIVIDNCGALCEGSRVLFGGSAGTPEYLIAAAAMSTNGGFAAKTFGMVYSKDGVESWPDPSFLARLEAKRASLNRGSSTSIVHALFSYDVVHTFASAVNVLSDAGADLANANANRVLGPALMVALRQNVTFTGVTGPISFGSDDNNRKTQFVDLFNIRASGHVKIGRSAKEGIFTIKISEQAIFHNGLTTVPPYPGCPKGMQSRAASSECAECTEDTFSEEVNSTSCTRCPAFTSNYGMVNSKTIMDCTCMANYYSRNATGGQVCLECPPNALCGGRTTQPYCREVGGYNKVELPHRVDFVLCSPADRCIGGSNCTCRPGHTGILCSTCRPGYQMFEDRCFNCKRGGRSKALIICAAFLGALTVYAILVNNFSNPRNGSTMSFAADHCQMILICAALNFEQVCCTDLHTLCNNS